MPSEILKRILLMGVFVVALFGLAPDHIKAADYPHDTVPCGGCHAGGFKDAMYDYSPNCLNCHKSGMPAANKPFYGNDASNIFGNYTATQSSKKWISHGWAIKGNNAAAGIAPGGGLVNKYESSSTGYRTWLKKNADEIMACPQCHYLHSNLTPGEPHLKYSMIQSGKEDFLCRDCHSQRNVTTGNTVSHPVGVAMQNKTAFWWGVPQNPYGISGSDLKLKNGKVYCTSCHGVHKADSNPYTNDTSFFNLSTGDGYLLRRYNNSDLCKSCHNYQDHGSMTCRNCHTPHNPGGNYKLIMRNFSTPPVNGVSRGKLTVWREVAGSKYAWRTDGKQGICDACHLLTTNSPQQGGGGMFINWSTAHASQGIYKSTAETVNCISCHPHQKVTASGTNSFFAGDAACSGCHGQPPQANSAGPGGYAILAGVGNYANDGVQGTNWFDEGQTPHKRHAVDYPYGNQQTGAAYGPGGKCRACHASANDTTTYHQQTPDNDSNYRTVTFGLYSWGSTKGSYGGAGDFQCTNVYCHSNGSINGAAPIYQTPRWGGTSGTYTKIPASANCGSCHADPMTSNKHPKHVTTYGFTCNNCHDNTTNSGVNTIKSTTYHVNRVKDIYFGTLAKTGGKTPTYNASTKKCSKTYCHGNMFGGYTAAPTFDGTAACGTCHDATSPEHSAGSHGKHAGAAAGQYDFVCSRCHDDQMNNNAQDPSWTGHVDGVKSIKFDASVMDNTGGSAPAGSPRPCQNIYCHSKGTDLSAPYDWTSTTLRNAPRTAPQWGNSYTCNDCHGSLAYSGIKNAMPNYSTTLPKANSHRKHVIDNNITCKDCHYDTTTDDTSINIAGGKHVNGVYDIKVRAAFDKYGAANTYSGGKCTNVDCHGSTASPVWGANGYCTDCHYSTTADTDNDAKFSNFSGVVAKLYSSQWVTRGHGKTSGTYGVTGNPAASKFCTACHDETVSHGDATKPFRTLNTGDMDAFCLGCHGSTSQVQASGLVYGIVTGIQNHTYANISTGGYKNLTTWRFIPKCVDCHDPHGDTNIGMIHTKVATGGSDSKGRKYAYVNASTVVFSKFTGDNLGSYAYSTPDKKSICRACHTRTLYHTQTGGTTHNSGKQCTNCHKHTTGFTPAGCNLGCHGYPPRNANQLVDGSENFDTTSFLPTGSTTAGAHQFHVETKAMNCSYCHTGGMDDAVQNNGKITLAFDAFTNYTTGKYYGQSLINGWTYEGKGYSGTMDNSKTCQSVKCHGGGNWLTHSGSGTAKIDPVWSGTIVCGNCHGAKNGGAATSWPTTGAHAKHAGTNSSTQRNYECKLCHNATIVVAPDTMAATHVNAQSQVELDQTTLINGSKYAQSTGGYSDTTVNSVYSACSGTYCHSLGNRTSVGNFTTPRDTALAWNLTAACNSCHGNANNSDWKKAMPAYPNGNPKFNSHTTHVTANSVMCQVCHTSTTSDSVSINSQTNHVNKVYNINFQADVGGSWTASTRTCTNTSCHAHKAPTWGQTAGTVTCQDCHYSTSADTDDFAFNTFTGVAAKLYSSHYMTTGHGRPAAAGNYPKSNNPPANKTCSACHDSGVKHGASNYFRIKTTWGSNADDICLSCHGSTAQVTPRSGEFGIRTGIQSHTRANLQAAGYTNLTTWHFTPKCIDCHDPHGDANIFMIHDRVSDEGSTSVGIPNKLPFSNQSAVAFKSVTSYDDGTGSQRLCVVCHDRTLHNGGPYAPTSHNNQGLDCRNCHKHKQGFNPSGCDGCHNYPPPNSPSTWSSDKTATPASVGLHTPHALNPRNRPGIPAATGYACKDCHGPNEDGTTTDHQNGKATATLFNMINTLGTTFQPYSSGKKHVVDDVCSNVKCHGGRAYARKWAKPADCDDCHGYANRINNYNNIGTGSHTMHTYSGTTFAAGKRYACTQCHKDHLNNYSTHYDSNVTMGFNLAPFGLSTSSDYSRGTSFETFTSGQEWGTCADTYCHGAKMGASSKANGYTNPKWGVPSTAECGDCHQTSTALGDDVTISQGAHTKHVATLGYGCQYCHASNTAKTHVDGTVTFKDGANLAGTTACQFCHQDSTTAKSGWASATTQTCDSCHNTTAVDVDNFVFTNITSGTKTVARINSAQWTKRGHGRTLTNYSSSNNPPAGLTCAKCHDSSVPHASFGGGSNPFRLISSNATPDRYCTRCHGQGEVGKASKTGIFTHASSVTNNQGRNWNYRMKCIDCHDPHGDNNIFMVHSTIYRPVSAPTKREASTSDGVPTGTAYNIDFVANNYTTNYALHQAATNKICQTCHEQTRDNAVTKARFRHDASNDYAHGTAKCINCHSHTGGFKGVACDACHGMPPISSSTRISGASQSDKTQPFTGITTVELAKHAPHINNLGGSLNDKCNRCHDGGMATTGGAFNGKIDIKFGGGMSIYTTGSYNGRNDLVNYTYQGDMGTLNDSLRCTTVKCHGGGNWLTSNLAGYPQIPSWRNYTTAECGDCHGAKKTRSTGSWPTTMAHAKHVNTATYKMMCITCHSSAIMGSHTTTVAGVHVNEQADVDLDDTDSRLSSVSNYDGDSVIGSGYGKCNVTYCHSDGNRFSNYSVPNGTLNWNGTATCNSCHPGPGTGPDYTSGQPKANSHNKHVVQKTIGCQQCHNVTTTDGSTIANYSTHVNKVYNVDISATYDTNGGTANYAGTTCSKVKCHGSDPTYIRSGAFGNDTTPTWGDTTSAECGDCHLTGTSSPKITQGAHGKHTGGAAGQYSYACTKCHTDSTHTNHVNMVKDFRDSQTIGSTVACQSCHKTEDPKSAWNNSTKRACGQATSCHAGRAAVSSMPGKHLKHLNATTYNTRFLCTYCHNWTVQAFNNDTSIKSTVFHANSTINVVFNGFANNSALVNGTYDSTKHQCKNTYCHSNGTQYLGTYGSNQYSNYTADWDVTPSDTCNYCHGNKSYSDWRKAMPNYTDGAPKANKHVIHVITNGLRCVTCHTLTLSNDSTISSGGFSTEHVDGNYDVDFPAKYDDPTDASYDTATKTCSQVKCHGGRNVKWDLAASTIRCQDCHYSSTADTDDFVWKNITSQTTVVAKIYSSEWMYSGHGRTTAFPLTGAPAASKTCTSCHDSSQAHNKASNPFRLFSTAGAGVKAAAFCKRTGCHATGTILHHAASTTAARYATFDLNCFDCHDPHGDALAKGNKKMIQKQIIAIPKASNNYTPSNVYGVPVLTNYSSKFVNFTAFAAGSDYASTAVATNITKVCNVCHSQTGTATGDAPRYRRNQSGTPSTHNSTSDCGGCHKHDGGFEGAGGESTGGSPCGSCHSSLLSSMQQSSSYHHYMQNADATYSNATTLTTTDTRRRCLMCHVDHDIFSPGVAGKQLGRAKNLRQTSTTQTNWSGINTDFYPAKNTGKYAATNPVKGGVANSNGVCMGCHGTEKLKNTTNRGAGDGSAKARGFSKFMYYSSSHNFQIAAKFSLFSSKDYANNSQKNFRANCSKCHGSKAFDKTVQDSAREKFGLHDVKYQSSMRSMGNYSSSATRMGKYLCYKCHGKSGGGVRGTYDYYSSIEMSSGAKMIQTAIEAKKYGHPAGAYIDQHDPAEYYNAKHGWLGSPASPGGVGSKKHVECMDCHNTHGGNAGIERKVGSANGNKIAGAQVGAWGVDKTSWPALGGSVRYTKMTPITYQWQLCAKCHGFFAWSSDTGPTYPSPGYNSYTGSPYMTDVMREFNPNNYGYHPVVQKGKNQPAPSLWSAGWPAGAVRRWKDTYNNISGFSSISGLDWAMIPPFNRKSTLACSDCHKADSTGEAVSQATYANCVSPVSNSGWTNPENLADADGVYAVSGNTALDSVEFDVDGSTFTGATLTEIVVIGYSNGKNKVLNWQINKGGASQSTGTVQLSNGTAQTKLATVTSGCTDSACTNGGTQCNNSAVTVKISKATAADQFWIDKASLQATFTITESLRGPHGSAYQWILPSVNTDLYVDWNGNGSYADAGDRVNDPTYVEQDYEKRTFCWNCHRFTTYQINTDNDGAGITNYGRLQHRQVGAASAGNHTMANFATNKWGIPCMTCHGGAKAGAIHGDWDNEHYLMPTANDMGRPVGVRLLNGSNVHLKTAVSSWPVGDLVCYVVKGSSVATSLGGCDGSGEPEGTISSTVFNYNYTAY